MAKIVVVHKAHESHWPIYLNAEQVVRLSPSGDEFWVYMSDDSSLMVSAADAQLVLRAMGYEGEVVA